MARVIKNTLYKVATESKKILVECKSREDLFCFVKRLVSEGVVVQRVTQINTDGSTPKVRVFTDAGYKALKGTNPTVDIEQSEMIGQIIDGLEDLLSPVDNEEVLFKDDIYDKTSTIIKETLSNYGCL